jgi:hypothetical protein
LSIGCTTAGIDFACNASDIILAYAIRRALQALAQEQVVFDRGIRVIVIPGYASRTSYVVRAFAVLWTL